MMYYTISVVLIQLFLFVSFKITAYKLGISNDSTSSTISKAQNMFVLFHIIAKDKIRIKMKML
jgi:hypothetical protein